jgi:hypothetical protein
LVLLDLDELLYLEQICDASFSDLRPATSIVRLCARLGQPRPATNRASSSLQLLENNPSIGPLGVRPA